MKKVIIIGGGFAGSAIAKKLENYFDVTLIDSKDYFEFTPGILRTIVEPEHIKKVQMLHTHYLKRAKVIVGCVSEVSEKAVFVGNQKIKFDYLAICSGSRYSAPIKEMEALTVTRAIHLRSYYERLCKAKRILIVGGGLVGVELAAEIAEHYDDKEIIIIHSQDRLIERNHDKAVRYAYNFLKKRGVIIHLNESVKKNRGNIFHTESGREVKADIAFLCTGIKPNFDFMSRKFSKSLNNKNKVIVNEHLQIEGFRNIFAAGDITDRVEEKTAQNAERQARVVAKNITLLERKEKLKNYHSRRTPLVISLGKYNGIFSWGNFVLTGIIPGLLKSFIEFREMRKLAKN